MIDTRRSFRGFTLLEVMVAIAMSLLLVLAISSLFASAGGTIATGRRLSTFTRQATIIERRMRQDFANLSREGYMVIRHAVADDGPNPGGMFQPWRVGAFADDANPRLRRVDEIMFFTRGQYATARSPLAPGYIAQGNAARVYYGQGAIADFNATDALLIPEYDMGVGGGGGPGGGGTSLQNAMGLLGEPGKPNEFAQDWILIRHQTVLAQPRSADQLLPANFLEPYENTSSDEVMDLMRDGDRQVAFQPAQSSIFRHVNHALGQGTDDTDMLREQTDYDRGRNLLGQSTMFDIATTDLREIYLRVMTMHDGADLASDYVPPVDPENDPLDGRRNIEILPVPPMDIDDEADLRDFPIKGYTPYLSAAHILGDANGERANLLFDGIHAWMRSGLPTDGGIASIETGDRGDDVEQELHSIRMHAELSPPELLTVLDPAEYDPKTLEAADRLNEQLMLSASNLGVRVGEFMVEWTFGQTYLTDPYTADPRNGELIWYGGHRLVDLDGDELADEVVFDEYQSVNLVLPEGPVLAFDRNNGRRIERMGSSLIDDVHRVHDFLIHGRRDSGDDERDNPLYSYFGWDDPTYAPDPTSTETEVGSLPWAWPTMLRVTISLIDKSDPTIEQSFQFVIELDPES